MIYFDSKNIGPIIPYEFQTIQKWKDFLDKLNQGGICNSSNLVQYENNKMAIMIGGNFLGIDLVWVATL